MKQNKAQNLFDEMEIAANSADIEVEGDKCCYYSVLVQDQLADKVVNRVIEADDLRVKENTISAICFEGAVFTFLDRLKEKAGRDLL